jgi:tol-pal system protein YbgF
MGFDPSVQWRSLGAATLLCIWLVPSAQAQSDDTLMLMSRLNDLENQVQALQQGGGKTAAGSMAPAGPAVADLDVRLSQVQDQIRALTGQLETQENEISQLKAENERVQSDIQQRLSDLEAKGGSGAGAVPQAGTGGQSYSPVLPPASVGAPVPLTGPAALAPQAETLGTISNDPGSGSPEKDYEAAYNLFGAGDYAGAERGFAAFLQHYPTKPLAANAQFWLGETYYNRNQFQPAAQTFAANYKQYPNGAKAPDSLLKLGMSLGQLGQVPQACLAFAQLAQQFPAASPKIKAALAQERTRYKCQ